MKRAFRDSYNRELALLRERTAEFAADYPGLADRLGGLLADNLDPAVAGLLEGTAFMAARVQLKIDEEFSTFTEALIDQLLPQALAPIPSVMLAQAEIPDDTDAIVDGLAIPRGAYMDARFRDADKRISCRFSLAGPLTIWPLELAGLQYFAAPGPLGALGQDVAPGTRAGLAVDFARVGPSGKMGGARIRDLALDRLDIHLTGPMAEATALYEQLIAGTTRISLRWLSPQGDPVFVHLPTSALTQGGFDRDERLLPNHTRLFDGYALLREFFIFPRKFMAVRLEGLQRYIKAMPGSEFQVVFEFAQADETLATRLGPDHMALRCVPAINLFEESAATVRVDHKHSEFVVMPNSTPVTHYEIHDILDVQAHFSSLQTRAEVRPLYALAKDGPDPRQSYFYTARHRLRRLSARERRYGVPRSQYRGTETYLSLYEPPGGEEIQRLHLRTLASNRHLPEQLPLSEDRNDFYLNDDQGIGFAVRVAPTPPRYPMGQDTAAVGPRGQEGHAYWRLISYLSLNQLGLEGRGGDNSAGALREMLSLFADHSDSTARAAVGGLIGVRSRPITRTIEMADGFHAARGLEVTLTFNEEDYESSGVIVIGAVLDRFLSEYAAVNSFTQVVIETRQRGHIKTWPARTGQGPLL